VIFNTKTGGKEELLIGKLDRGKVHEKDLLADYTDLFILKK